MFMSLLACAVVFIKSLTCERLVVYSVALVGCYVDEVDHMWDMYCLHRCWRVVIQFSMFSRVRDLLHISLLRYAAIV